MSYEIQMGIASGAKRKTQRIMSELTIEPTNADCDVKLQVSTTDKGVEPKYYRNTLKQLLTMDEILYEFQM